MVVGQGIAFGCLESATPRGEVGLGVTSLFVATGLVAFGAAGGIF